MPVRIRFPVLELRIRSWVANGSWVASWVAFVRHSAKVARGDLLTRGSEAMLLSAAYCGRGVDEMTESREQERPPEAEFSIQSGKPTLIRIKDPLDGKDRVYAVGINIVSVSRVGVDEDDRPKYLIQAATSFSLIDPETGLSARKAGGAT